MKTKIIHYCWFGNQKKTCLNMNCIKSWKYFFPDYKVQLWNERNFDVHSCLYTEQAYQKYKYAFISDYVRLYALYNFGGLYFDTDYEVLKEFDNILDSELVMGFESVDKPLMAMLYSPPKNPLIKKLMTQYELEPFIDINGQLNLKTNVDRMKDLLIAEGVKFNGEMQKFKYGSIYPISYFSPLAFETGAINISENSYGIHVYSGSWLSEEQKNYFKLKRGYGRKMAKDIVTAHNINVKSTITYSIIITFYKNTRVLLACLDRLLWSLSNRNDFEIIIVNDNPNINLTNVLKKYKNFIDVINLKENLGYSGACNVGSKKAIGEFLIFMDSDIIVTYQWLDELLRCAQSNPNFGAISSCTLRMQNNTVEYFGMYLYESDSIKPRYNFSNSTLYTSEDKCCPIVTSTCMLIKSSRFKQVGGFDELLYNSHCDLDLSLRLAPYKNYIAAKSIVYHRSTTSGDIRTVSYTKARSLFYKKWGNYDMRNLTINTLKTLYSEFSLLKTTNYYVVINFGTSVFSKEYINALLEGLEVTAIQQYNIRLSTTQKINLLDEVDWLITLNSIPIIYFCDQFTQLTDNYVWFQQREFKRDLIADMNGNIIRIDSLV